MRHPFRAPRLLVGLLALVGLLQATGVVLIAVGVATRGAQVEVSANATGLRVSGHFD